MFAMSSDKDQRKNSLSRSLSVNEPQHKFLPIREAPSGSLDVENSTGSCVVGVDTSVVVQQMLCEEPQATRVIL